jgi:hypothetical protein
MRRTVQGIVLALALSIPIYAGDMQCPIVETPPPQPQQAASVALTDEQGVNSADQIETDITASESVTGVMLNLLQTLLSLS